MPPAGRYLGALTFSLLEKDKKCSKISDFSLGDLNPFSFIFLFVPVLYLLSCGSVYKKEMFLL